MFAPAGLLFDLCARDVHLASLAVWNLQAAVDAIEPKERVQKGAATVKGGLTTAKVMRLRDVSGRARLGVELAVVDGKRLGVQVRFLPAHKQPILFKKPGG